MNFPASSPHVLSCGGTSLTAAGGRIGEEVAWNDGPNGGATGGGRSKIFPPPHWQSKVKAMPASKGGRRPGRMIPDVSAHASPNHGYRAFVNGQWIVLGGTIGATGLWAGLIALLNQALGYRLGQFSSGPL